MKRILLTTLITSVILVITLFIIDSMNSNCLQCHFYFIIVNLFTIVWGALCATIIFSFLTRLINFYKFALKIILGIILLGLSTQTIIWLWAALEVFVFDGGFSNLTFISIKNCINKEFKGLPLFAFILTILIPIIFTSLNRIKVMDKENQL
jgi:hypothetical protein